MSKKQKKNEVVATLELHAELESQPLLLASFPDRGVLEGLQLDVYTAGGKKVQLSAETEVLSVTGTNFGRCSGKHDAAHWAVGVYDPASEQVSLHHVDHIYPLRSSVTVG